MALRPFRASLAAAAASSLVATMAIAVAPAGAGPRAPDNWSTYFYPRVVGFACEESFDSAASSGSETLKVTKLVKIANGVNVTIGETGSAQTGETVVPVNATLHYTLTKSGALISAPSGVGVAKRTANVTGNTTFPSVSAMLSGRSLTETFHEVYPLSSSEKKQLQGALLPHQTSLKVNLTLKNKGALVPTLTIPLGTLHRVLRIDTTLQGLTVTNATKSARKELGTALATQLKQEIDVSTWYAPHFGPVQVTDHGITTVANSCVAPK